MIGLYEGWLDLPCWHNLDTNKIIKYLKVLQHVSDHRGSIIREPCTFKLKHTPYRPGVAQRAAGSYVFQIT